MGSKNSLVSNFKYLNLKNVGCHVFASVVGTNSLVFAKCFYWIFEWQYKIQNFIIHVSIFTACMSITGLALFCVQVLQKTHCGTITK